MLRQITNVHNLKLDRKNFSDLHVLNAEHYVQLCNKTNMSTKSELATEITEFVYCRKWKWKAYMEFAPPGVTKKLKRFPKNHIGHSFSRKDVYRPFEQGIYATGYFNFWQFGFGRSKCFLTLIKLLTPEKSESRNYYQT